MSPARDFDGKSNRVWAILERAEGEDNPSEEFSSKTKGEIAGCYK